MASDVGAIKRAGLPVDLDRLTAEGEDWLSAGERYALKTYGVCAQAQPGVFMIRCRTGGSVEAGAARSLARVAERYGGGWLHLTTRQQVELHHVRARDVAAVLDAVRAAGLTTFAACGHTVRGVMSCPDAGVGAEEPFDCGPDADAVAASVLALGQEFNARMPQRFNFAFGGCPECRNHARLNDAGFVSVVRGSGRHSGEPGYELWIGGGLGKSAPTFATRALDFVPRTEVLPAAHALLEVFIEHNNLDQPGRGRMKFVIRRLGVERFLELFRDAYAAACTRPWPAPAPVTVVRGSAFHAGTPAGGWGGGVRPQWTPGMAMVTADMPLGDLDGQDLRSLADLADRDGDGRLYLTRKQNVMFRDVPLDAVPRLRAGLTALGFGLEGSAQARDIRACVGGPVCNLALTPAQRPAHLLAGHPALVRNPGLRVSLSGCPNSCAQHQIADLGFSGSHVTIGGVATLGYQVWVGGDLRTGVFARTVGRVAEDDVPAMVGAVVEVWEGARQEGESLPATVRRVGPRAFGAELGPVFDGRWEPGEEG